MHCAMKYPLRHHKICFWSKSKACASAKKNPLQKRTNLGFHSLDEQEETNTTRQEGTTGARNASLSMPKWIHP
jgi:hypothetical protein